MGPPSRSLAAEANDCFMIRIRYGYTEYKYAVQELAPNGRFSSVRFVISRPYVIGQPWRNCELLSWTAPKRMPPRETPNKVGGGGGLATEAYLLTAACLEAV